MFNFLGQRRPPHLYLCLTDVGLFGYSIVSSSNELINWGSLIDKNHGLSLFLAPIESFFFFFPNREWKSWNLLWPVSLFHTYYNHANQLLWGVIGFVLFPQYIFQCSFSVIFYFSETILLTVSLNWGKVDFVPSVSSYILPWCPLLVIEMHLQWTRFSTEHVLEKVCRNDLSLFLRAFLTNHNEHFFFQLSHRMLTDKTRSS